MHAELQSVRRPSALATHSTIGVVSPASFADAATLQAGCHALREASGCKVAIAETGHIGNFAGSAEARAAALMAMWRREDVGAIICSRGGYGSNYLLPLLDLDAMRAAPKSFVGYSDNTALLLALERAGVACFHGPMVASDFACGREDTESFFDALHGLPLDFDFSPHSGVETLVSGEAHGSIVGGCLSVAVTSLGTPWEIDSSGKLLFFEDVHERPFRIDRMLRHLLLAGKFQDVRGIIFGAMHGCAALSGEESLQQMIYRVLGELTVPIAFGFPSGHVESGNLTLPFGVPATLECTAEGVRLRVDAATVL